MDDATWDVTVFSKHRERLLHGDIAEAFFQAVLQQARERSLLSDELFSVDGTLLEAWASVKSYQRKDAKNAVPPDDPGNAGWLGGPSLSYQKRVPHCFAFFAKGWETVARCASGSLSASSRVPDRIGRHPPACYFSFTKSSTKIAQTPTVRGNCTKEASRSAFPLGRAYVASNMARAVSTPRINLLFQFMGVRPPFLRCTSKTAGIFLLPTFQGFLGLSSFAMSWLGGRVFLRWL
jgi:hypothetical protein